MKQQTCKTSITPGLLAICSIRFFHALSTALNFIASSRIWRCMSEARNIASRYIQLRCSWSLHNKKQKLNWYYTKDWWEWNQNTSSILFNEKKRINIQRINMIKTIYLYIFSELHVHSAYNPIPPACFLFPPLLVDPINIVHPY